MNCHNCEIQLTWDGFSPIVVCDICRSYRSVDTPDDTANKIVSLNRPGRVHCPCCRRKMTQAAIDGLKVEHCAKCQGILLDDAVFAMFVRNRRSEFREAALQPIILLDEQRDLEVHCPMCRGLMEVHPCYGPGFIIIDSCDCGMVWMDFRETALSKQESGQHLFLVRVCVTANSVARYGDRHRSRSQSPTTNQEPRTKN